MRTLFFIKATRLIASMPARYRLLVIYMQETFSLFEMQAEYVGSVMRVDICITTVPGISWRLATWRWMEEWALPSERVMRLDYWMSNARLISILFVQLLQASLLSAR